MEPAAGRRRSRRLNPGLYEEEDDEEEELVVSVPFKISSLCVLLLSHVIKRVSSSLVRQQIRLLRGVA